MKIRSFQANDEAAVGKRLEHDEKTRPNIAGYTALLMCHPETRSQAVQGIETCLRPKQDGALALTYLLKGDLSRLLIPPPGVPRRADRLWQHTCFEAFVRLKGSTAYYEFNFAASGEWAAYTFRSYRDGVPLEDEELSPRIAVHSAVNSLDLQAVIRLDRLLSTNLRAPLGLALSAVIEEKSGLLSYWALRHPPGKPDFHHPDAFALELEEPNLQAQKESASSER